MTNDWNIYLFSLAYQTTTFFDIPERKKNEAQPTNGWNTKPHIILKWKLKHFKGSKIFYRPAYPKHFCLASMHQYKWQGGKSKVRQQNL